ncbi:MAG: hypothetical protein ABWY25_12855, partial [Paenisporosarcina sp.]
ITLSGFDFVVLREEDSILVLPYSHIETIKPFGRFAEPYHDAELSSIDPCFRRELTFHFGDVVSSSPELIHLFFRVYLAIYLLLFEDERLQIVVDGSPVEGILTDVHKDSIVLSVQEVKTIIPIEMISLIKIKV